MKLPGYHTLFLAGLLIVQGCTVHHYTYMNQLPHTPAFTDGRQGIAAMQVNPYGVDLQTSVSPIKNLGISGGYFMGFQGNQRFYNYGLSYYKKIYTDERRSWYATLHAQRDIGKIRGAYSQKEQWPRGTSHFVARIRYTGFTLQPSIYIVQPTLRGIIFNYGIIFRVTQVNYSDFYFKRTFMVGFDTLNNSTDVRNIPNTSFYGAGAMLFINLKSTNSPFFLSASAGFMPNPYNWQLADENTSAGQKWFRFQKAPWSTFSAGLLLGKRKTDEEQRKKYRSRRYER